MTISTKGITAQLGTQEAMHQAMVACIGQHETNGNNINDITKWYGMNGEPWCDMTITWAAYHSGNYASACFNTKHAYTVEHAQKFKDHGEWTAMTHGVVGSGIKAGDIIFFDWSGGSGIGGIDHVGYVESVSGSVVHTIEGNEMNICGRFSRTVEVIAGFGRPKYAAAPKPVPKPTPTPKPTPKPTVKYEPFPGVAFFKIGKKSPIVTAMHKRLVAEKCNKYQTSSNTDTVGTGDVASYEAWQRKCGYSGKDAAWPPGKATWDKLKVPNV